MNNFIVIILGSLILANMAQDKGYTKIAWAHIVMALVSLGFALFAAFE